MTGVHKTYLSTKTLLKIVSKFTFIYSAVD